MVIHMGTHLFKMVLFAPVRSHQLLNSLGKINRPQVWRKRQLDIGRREGAWFHTSKFSGCKSGEHVRIYTRTGDKGTSSTFTGERRPKDDVLFQALGSIDELSAVLGLARTLAGDAGHDYCSRLGRLQCELQEVASLVATPRSSARAAHMRRTGESVPQVWITELEYCVDEYTKQLAPLRNFILPGGGVAGSTLHLARTVCRRAERSVVPLTRAGDVHLSVGIYLNRLSDLLFTMARLAAKEDGVDEEIYVAPAKPVASTQETATNPSMGAEQIDGASNASDSGNRAGS